MKSDSIPTLHDLVMQDIPIDFLSSVVHKTLPKAYKNARKMVKEECAAPEAKTMLPYFRRFKAEQLIRAEARNYPEIKVDVLANKAKNAFYTRLISGRISMTISAVDSPQTMVRHARFRKTRAKRSRIQLSLPGQSVKEPTPDTDDYYYAILLHPTVSSDNDKFYFANLAFPSKNCKDYLENINLFTFLNNYSRLKNTAEEVIEDDLGTKIKPQVKEGTV